jgi:hypothetical protein
MPLSLLGNGSVNTFHRQRSIVGDGVLYAMHVVSKKIRPLVLPRPSCFIHSLFKDVVSSQVVGLLVNTELRTTWGKRSWPHLRFYSGISLEGLRSITKTPVQDSRCAGRNRDRASLLQPSRSAPTYCSRDVSANEFSVPRISNSTAC